MSDKITQFTKLQKYRFDFGADDKLYVVMFHSNIPQAELRFLISSFQNCLYEKMSEVILLYLKQHYLEYSNFNCIEIPLEQNAVMDWADYLLHSNTYKKVDENLENADIYYAVMDCQYHTQKHHRGCYFAVKKTACGHEKFEYHTIIQTFSSINYGCEEHGYFAIRKSDGNGDLQEIWRKEGEPILPSFGCVDMIGLLLNIEAIEAKEDAVRTAIR